MSLDGTVLAGGGEVPFPAEGDIDSLFWAPSRLGVDSAWWGHVPFAHWLVTAVRPRGIVELGTHNGVSFSAFCQAVQRGGITARCHAVDTWRGDEHAGFYDDSVHDDLAAFIGANYGTFAELVRSTFDGAVGYFADGGIDLLHIDGLHTYEAVRHDFETWRPKLSQRAVVLFHDTNVRERDFGVWRLWSDLQRHNPAFEFFHGHGLGVVAIGQDPPQALLELARLREPAASRLRDWCARIGERWVAAETLRQTQAHAGRVETGLSEYKQHAGNLEAKLNDYKRHASGLEAQIGGLRQELAELQAGAERSRAEAGAARDLAQQMAAMQTRLRTERAAKATLKQELMQLEQESRRLAAATDHDRALLRELGASMRAAERAAMHNQHLLQNEVAAAHAEVAALRSSTSWRITAPLRAVKGGARRAPTPRPAPAPIVWPAIVQEEALQAVRARALTDHPSRTDADVRLIEESGFLDEEFYAGMADAQARGIDPVLHYLRHGEAAGLAPCEAFDPAFYRARHPDVAEAMPRLLVHYLRHGRAEGRSATPAAGALAYPTAGIDPSRATVIVAVHEATRTGAVILAWNLIDELRRTYNVVALLKSGGPLAPAMESVASAVIRLPEHFIMHRAETDALAVRLKLHYAPLYAVANSAETRYFVSSLERAGVPVVALLHEFSTNVRPLGALHELFETASSIVFSARIVAESALDDYHSLASRPFEVLPQGACRLPASLDGAATADEDDTQGNLSLMPGNDGSLLVVGLGTITIRKGVEFFILAAAATMRRKPTRRIIFAWVGRHYWFDEGYLDYCKEQVARSGLDETSFRFLGEFSDLEPIYRRADICMLPSRLDPLPNTAIDAAVHGVPVVCFDQASGMADILKGDPRTRELVVPYLDADAAAQLITELAADQTRLDGLSTAMRDIAAVQFDLARYASEIDRLGLAGRRAVKQVETDRGVIERSGLFDPGLYGSGWGSAVEQGRELDHYLHVSRLVGPRNRPRAGLILRRPMPGFHPCIYAADHAAYDEKTGEDPLAHYIRTGFPKGRWAHEVIRPGSGSHRQAEGLRIALHVHFHYTDMLPDFLLRLRRNATPVDLLITTTSEDRAATIAEIVAAFGIARVTIESLPNRGRDIGAMLTGLGRRLLDYDLVGHLHGKRSPHAPGNVGENWRVFLWEHLIGGEHPMIDVIADAFAGDPTLGLVFPEDPHLNDWDSNRPIAEALAARAGWHEPLPNHFDFPIGNAFWVRPKVLAPLIDLGLTWDDYPAEPVPIDGTSLHALERLIPFAAQFQGFHLRATYVQGCTR